MVAFTPLNLYHAKEEEDKTKTFFANDLCFYVISLVSIIQLHKIYPKNSFLLWKTFLASCWHFERKAFSRIKVDGLI